MSRIRVYYNSACPVCRAGIEDQRCRMEAKEVTGVEWLDVHANPELAHEVHADLEHVRERLHVKEADGSIRVGPDAFATLFARTPGQKWLGRLLALPLVRPLAAIAYNLFARLLYNWNRAKGRW